MPDEQATYRDMVIGIDPGPTESAYALIDPDYTIVDVRKLENGAIHAPVGAWLATGRVRAVACEGIQCYGMAVGREVFETAYMVGEFRRGCWQTGVPWSLIPRQEYARAICGTAKISDAILRQALLLRFGPDTKDGPLHALKGSTDLRSAFAIAVYWLDRQRIRL